MNEHCAHAPYTLFCSRCNREFTLESKLRFCSDCGSLLKTLYVEIGTPNNYPLDEEKVKIAEYVYNEYEEIRKEIGNLELDLLNSISVDSAYGRFDMIFLATLFSGWAMREERAYSIWKYLNHSFQESKTCLYDYLLKAKKTQLDQLNKQFKVPPKIISNILSTARILQSYDGDINELIDNKSWDRTLEKIRTSCKGVNQKVFWVARVMRQKKAWSIPGQYCCVSDSHNKALLKKTGFIKSDDDLYNNSLIMWKYFNEPFENKYYDLPLFRFAQIHGCKKCNIEKCNFETLSNC